ncbi:hypothetical protein ACM64Y_17810 [Novispirillum sp. DQ9]|uniref:hypothetical protein n=1 Tax=Novispirillum sp. DQ9 TaxID=3398612 RepID=UPI003C7A0BAB
MRPLLAAAALVLVAATPAGAYDAEPRRYATSTAPYWSVGTLNQDLSRLCQQGRFNQKRIGEMYIAFIGEEGKGITGIAKTGYNLYDPENKADPAKTYHFFSDATTNCKVYVAP